MSAAKRAAGLALAGIIGVGLAVALFPSPPAPPEPVEVAKRPKKSKVSRSTSGAPPAAEERAAPAGRTDPRGDPSQAERPNRGDGGPMPPGVDGSERPLPPPGRAGDPISRHLMVDADGWLRVAESLAEAGLKSEAEQAGKMARQMRDASNQPREQLNDLFIQERELLVSVQQSAIGSQLSQELVGLEMGLTAAQQGGTHPVDMPRKNQGSPGGTTKGPDTGLE